MFRGIKMTFRNLLERVKGYSEVLADALKNNNRIDTADSILSIMHGSGLIFETNADYIDKEVNKSYKSIMGGSLLDVHHSYYRHGFIDIWKCDLEAFLDDRDLIENRSIDELRKFSQFEDEPDLLLKLSCYNATKDAFDRLVEILEEYERYPILDDESYCNAYWNLVDDTVDELVKDDTITDDERELAMDWLCCNASNIDDFLDYSTDDLKAYIEEKRK